MCRNIKKVMTAALCLAAFWLVAAPAVYADDWDKATRITVNQPFEIPGTILPAGTYIVKLVDIAGERHVVRFLSEDGKKVYATLIGIPDYRLEPTDKTAITFYESDLNRPRPLHNWFYPGHLFGIEFAYPKTRAVEIATATEEPVVAFKEPEFVFREEPAPVTVEELLEEPLVEVTPGGEEVAISETYPEFTPTPEPELDIETFARELPRTATPFPVLGLVGLLAAGVASAIRLRK
jgi:hypothetical protein